jgi:hypothetical protein
LLYHVCEGVAVVPVVVKGQGMVRGSRVWVRKAEERREKREERKKKRERRGKREEKHHYSHLNRKKKDMND